MKYIIKDGAFVAKENGEETNTISGKLTAIHVVKPEEGSEKLQFDLTDESAEEGPVVRTVVVRKVGDAALKILRCLYGIADIVAGKTITLELEPREGKSALINVSADGEPLYPAGVIEPFAADKKLFIDKAVSTLLWAFKFRLDVVVFANDDNHLPDTAGETAAYIREMRAAGRSEEIHLVKTSFTNQKAANGYLKALRDIGKGFTSWRDEQDIAAIMEAWEGPLGQDGDSVPDGDDNDSEVEY